MAEMGGEGIEGPLDLLAWRKQKQRNWRGVGAPRGPPGLCKEEHLRGGQSHACVAVTCHVSLTLLPRRKKWVVGIQGDYHRESPRALG